MSNPLPAAVPTAPCRACGRVCWLRASYAERVKREIWYCGGCGEQYLPPAGRLLGESEHSTRGQWVAFRDGWP